MKKLINKILFKFGYVPISTTQNSVIPEDKFKITKLISKKRISREQMCNMIVTQEQANEIIVEEMFFDFMKEIKPHIEWQMTTVENIGTIYSDDLEMTMVLWVAKKNCLKGINNGLIQYISRR